MKQYIDEDGSVWAFEQDGSQDYLITASMKPYTPPAEAPEPSTKEKIEALEASVTARRLREAILGIDDGWLADIDRRISALRGGAA